MTNDFECPETGLSETERARLAWKKPVMTSIKPGQAWVKPTLERLSLKDALTSANTTNILDGPMGSGSYS